MTTNTKNPHPPGTPMWQLWEGMTSLEAQARAWREDAERYLRKAGEARARAKMFLEALERLEEGETRQEKDPLR